MKTRSTFLSALTIVMWTGLMIISWLFAFDLTACEWDYLFCFSVYVYCIALPLGIIRSVEGRNVVERLRLQPSKYLGLIILGLISIAIFSHFGNVENVFRDDSFRFIAIILAPLSEEIFFRGIFRADSESQNRSVNRDFLHLSLAFSWCQ